MKSLNIPATENTLDIRFDADTGELTLGGSSFPENTPGFFQPLFDWLEEYLTPDRSVHLRMSFTYLNSGSIKCILTLLRILGEYHQKGGRVNAIWEYTVEDEDICDLGERIARLTRLPIELIAVSSR